MFKSLIASIGLIFPPLSNQEADWLSKDKIKYSRIKLNLLEISEDFDDEENFELCLGENISKICLDTGEVPFWFTPNK